MRLFPYVPHWRPSEMATHDMLWTCFQLLQTYVRRTAGVLLKKRMLGVPNGWLKCYLSGEK